MNKIDDIAERFSYEINSILKKLSDYSFSLSSIDYSNLEEDTINNIKKLTKVLVQLKKAAITYADAIINNPEMASCFKLKIFDIVYELISITLLIKQSSCKEQNFLDTIQKFHQTTNVLCDFLTDDGVSKKLTRSNIKKAKEKKDFILSEKLKSLDSDNKHLHAKILVIDDDPLLRKIMERQLERLGHTVFQASDGKEALIMLSSSDYDIAIVDMMMPEMNGFEFLEAVKKDPRLSNLSTIVISAISDSSSIARCIELGAEDYLGRDFDPIILRARINSILEKKAFKRENDEVLNQLLGIQERLSDELRDAATYVKSLLPKKCQWKNIRTDWEFIPSLSLGGDCFNYHKLDDNRIAMYLLDVSGHGIQAALLSATIMNVLRNFTLSGMDYASPSSILYRLNQSFKMEDQNNMFFTIWYGVYDTSTSLLRYASAGSHPAVLIGPSGSVQELIGDGPVIGIDDNAVFNEFDEIVESGSNLYLFSDGLFEIHTKNGAMLSWYQFIEMLVDHHSKSMETSEFLSPISMLLDAIKEKSAKPIFDDDVSIVVFHYN